MGATYGTTPGEHAAGSSGDPLKGRSIRRRYWGTAVQIDALEQEAIAVGRRYDRPVPEPGEFPTLEVEYGPDELHPNKDVPVSDEWSLAGSMLQQSIWISPKVLALWEPLSMQQADLVPGLIATFRRWLTELARGQFRSTDTNGDPFSLTYAAIAAAAARLGLDTTALSELAKTLCRGVETKATPVWVLKRQVVLVKGTGWRWSTDNVGKIFPTTAALVSGESVPTTEFDFDLPEGVWLKCAPTQTQDRVTWWRRVAQQEYKWAERAEWFLYDPAT
jgi:hypothetical protein